MVVGITKFALAIFYWTFQVDSDVALPRTISIDFSDPIVIAGALVGSLAGLYLLIPRKLFQVVYEITRKL